MLGLQNWVKQGRKIGTSQSRTRRIRSEEQGTWPGKQDRAWDEKYPGDKGKGVEEIEETANGGGATGDAYM